MNGPSGEELVRFVARRNGRKRLDPGDTFDWLAVSLSSGPGSHDFATDEFVARECGVSRRTVVRWRQGGGVRWHDDICDRLGVHPSEVWGSTVW